MNQLLRFDDEWLREFEQVAESRGYTRLAHAARFELKERERRRKALDEMIRESYEMGLYDVDYEVYREVLREIRKRKEEE